jgi:hypothetical protein
MGQPGGFPSVPLLTDSGDLPRGRFCVSLEDVEKRFVSAAEYEGSTTREQVWSDFNDVIDLIRRKRAAIPAAFLGGSFVSSELNPSDVDAALFIDFSRIRNGQTYADVEQIVNNPKTNLGLQVDAFIIPWHPDGTELGGGDWQAYVRERSRWDDFWQRKVAKPDRQPPQRHHSMPLRGYLEVIIDDYR